MKPRTVSSRIKLGGSQFSVALSVAPTNGRRRRSAQQGPREDVTPPSLFAIPQSMQEEHADLHRRLSMAIGEPGEVGVAAREVARVLHAHFAREEKIALPPLALLRRLAAGEFDEEMLPVLRLTDQLQAELPIMIAEHDVIRAAVQTLRDTANRNGRIEAFDLAEDLRLHALTEEEVTYPAAVLVGRYLRALQGEQNTAGDDALSAPQL